MGEADRTTPGGAVGYDAEVGRVALLFDRAAVALLTVLANSALLVVLFRDAVPRAPLLGFAAFLWAVTLARFLLVRAYRRDPVGRDPSDWERRFVLGSLANGVGWGVGGALLVSGDLVLDVVVTFVVGGMVAGASSSTATSRRAFLAYSIPAVVPLAVALVAQGETHFAVMGLMLVLFGVAMSVLARQGGTAIVEALRLRAEKAALVAALERSSRERANRLRLLLEKAGVLTIVADPVTLAILDASGDAPALLGRVNGGAGEPTLAGLASKSASDWADVIASADRGEEPVFETAVDVDGQPIHVEVAVTVHDVGGARYALVVARDTTQRKALEAQLAHATHLASLGTLAAGVAHEINNPLTYVTENLRQIREALVSHGRDEGRGELVSLLDETAEGAERIRRIVKDLVGTAKRDETERIERVDLRAVLGTCLNMAEGELRHRARVEVVIREIPEVAGSTLRLTQVFLNLLLNAAQAIPDGDASHNLVRVVAEHDPVSDRVRVSVRDTGSGIAPEHLSRIFEPFYTTKPIGRGSGLGLAVCHGIVTRSGGQLTVETEVGKGTTFVVELLPVHAVDRDPTPPKVVTEAPRSESSPRYRILVVDDDVRVARATKRILREHDVTVASNAREAIPLICDGPGFDVVLCDLMMPDMSGEELYREVRRRAPNRVERIVFATGGAFTDSARALVATTHNICLEKPFELDKLREAVEAVAASRTEGSDGHPASDAPPVG